MPSILLEKSREIAIERMNSQNKNNAPVVDVTGEELKSDAVKNNIA